MNPLPKDRSALSLEGEDGSIIMALLASIVVGGLITVIIASTITGQRSARFDQQFTGAVHVAEAGVQEAVFMLNDRLIVGVDSDHPAFPVEEGPYVGTIDGQSYEWEATQISDYEWLVVSTSTTDGVNRTVEAIIADRPLYNLAAFSDVLVGFAGNNLVDSYDSRVGEWCTGNGRVGSNDNLEFNGVSASDICTYERPKQTVDGVDLFGWDDDPDPGRCQHHGQGNNCYQDDNPANAWHVQTHKQRIELDSQVEWMEEVLAECGDDVAPVKSSDFPGGAIPPAASGGTNPKTVQDPDPDNDGYIYCAETLTFDVHTSLSGASADNPVVFVVEKQVNAALVEGNRLRVNCPAADGCNQQTLTPQASGLHPNSPALQIFTPASDQPGDPGDPVIRVNGHSRIGALILAPNGTCAGGAQAHIFGALFCGEIGNVGGWNFHFDDALMDLVRAGEYVVSRWAEL